MNAKIVVGSVLCLAVPVIAGASPSGCCLESFDFMVEQVRANYAGWHDRPDLVATEAFSGNTRRLRELAGRTAPADCVGLLDRWIRQFEDFHLAIRSPAGFTWSDRIRVSEGPRSPSILFPDAATVVISAPSFAPRYKKALDELLSSNRAVILSSENLVIDIRGNSGGADATFHGLIPTFYTDPIRFPPGVVWASAANLELWNGMLARNPDNPFLLELVEDMRSRPDSFVTMGSGLERTEPVVHPKPEKVAILIDDMVASSAEVFLLYAQQSRKVTIYGQSNTLGAVDYLNANRVALPCPELEAQLQFATTKRSIEIRPPASGRQGIAPDVRVPSEVADPLAFVLARLARAVRPQDSP